jgi:hypothetical protein
LIHGAGDFKLRLEFPVGKKRIGEGRSCLSPIMGEKYSNFKTTTSLCLETETRDWIPRFVTSGVAAQTKPAGFKLDLGF